MRFAIAGIVLVSLSGAAAQHSFSIPVCPRGWHPVLPIDVRGLQGGGVEVVYRVAGHRNIEAFPPPGFHAVTASAAQRAEYGVPPPPPEGTADYAARQRLVSHLRFSTPSSAGLCVSRTVLPGSPAVVRPR